METIGEQSENPDFVDLTLITPPDGVRQVSDLPPGMGGFACVEQDAQGNPTRVVLSDPYELSS